MTTCYITCESLHVSTVCIWSCEHTRFCVEDFYALSIYIKNTFSFIHNNMIQHNYNEFSFNQIQSSKCSLFILFGGTLHLSQKNITVQKLIPFSASTGTPFLNGYSCLRLLSVSSTHFILFSWKCLLYIMSFSAVCVCDSRCNPMWVHARACAILCGCVLSCFVQCFL